MRCDRRQLWNALLALTTAGLPARAAAQATRDTKEEAASESSPRNEPLRAITPRSPAEAAYLSLSPLSSTNTMQLRLGYTGVDGGGHLASGELRAGLWMPYVVVPGIEVPRMGSLWVLGLPYLSFDLPELPETSNGIGDTTVVEQTVYAFSWGGIALGPLMSLPSATSPALGQGKLQLGPLASLGIAAPNMLITLSASNVWSVAGPSERADINTLLVTPTVGILVFDASFLFTDPVFRFDWERDGHATLPVNLGIGHAFTARFVGTLQGEWIATGDFEDSYAVRVVASDLGW